MQSRMPLPHAPFIDGQTRATGGEPIALINPATEEPFAHVESAKPDDIDKQIKEAKTNGYRVVTLLVFRSGDYRWVALRIDQS